MLKSEYMDAIEKIPECYTFYWQLDNALFELKHLAEQYEREHHDNILFDLLRTYYFDGVERRTTAINDVVKDTFEEDGWRGVYNLFEAITYNRCVFKLLDEGNFVDTDKKDLNYFKNQLLTIIQNHMTQEELDDRNRKQREQWEQEQQDEETGI